MIKALIWGTGGTAKLGMEFLKDDIEVQAFVETAPNKEVFMGKRVINIYEICEHNYDYIIVFSKFNTEILNIIKALKISSEKIVVWNMGAFMQYSEFYRDHFHARLKKFDAQEGKIELLSTGISYHNDGIDPEQFPMKAFNFALRAQDLFYDFEIVKFLNETRQDKCNLKHVIIGLNYYSFEYDFSKSVSCKEITRYFPEIKSPHNMMNEDYYEKFVEQEKERLEKYKYFDKVFQVKIPTYELNDVEGRNAAVIDFNKNYPITLYENTEILNEYLNYLEQRHIKPIILIMPATTYYTKFCPSEKKELFYNTLNEVLKKHDVQVLDYFETYKCPDSHYYHITHFNEIGAREFTKKLVKDIEW